MALLLRTPLATRALADELVGVVRRASFDYLRAGMWALRLHVLAFLVQQHHVCQLEVRGAVLRGKHLVEVLDHQNAENQKFLANCLIHYLELRVEEVNHQ